MKKLSYILPELCQVSQSINISFEHCGGLWYTENSKAADFIHMSSMILQVIHSRSKNNNCKGYLIIFGNNCFINPLINLQIN